MSGTWNGASKMGLVFLAVLTVSGAQVGAQNLTENGDFDLDTAGWEEASSGPNPDWSTVDHDSCGNDSGSARLENDAAGAEFGVWFTACVPGLVAGAPYSFDGYLRFPPGQSRTGNAKLTIQWFDSELDCEGNFLFAESPSLLSTSNPDVWVHRALRDVVAPAGAQSAWLRLDLFKEEAGGTLAANFDGIHLVSGNGYLFGDGFENSSTCRWTDIVP